MNKLIGLLSLFLVLSCADEVIHDDRTGRNVAGLEVEKGHRLIKKGDPFQYRCRMSQGVYKQSGCYCKNNKEFFNPFNGVCE